MTAQGAAAAPARTGQGALTASVVLRHASGLLQIGWARVVVAALVLFLEPAVVSVVIENATWANGDPSLATLLGGAALVFAMFVRLLTPVFFAGYLDEVIGKEYFDGHHRRWHEIALELPWARLVIADIALIAAIEIGLALLVIPGIIVCTCFALVGPVVVQERRPVVDAFRRTYRISMLAVRLVVILVVIPLLGEGLVAEALHVVLHNAPLGVQVLAEWLTLATLGGAIGLLEVALATELMRRNPEPTAVAQPG